MTQNTAAAGALLPQIAEGAQGLRRKDVEGRITLRWSGLARADQEARSVLILIRPVPAQALQTMRSPRSRTRPVPQQRTQVCWTTGGARSLCTEKRFPKSIRMSFISPDCEGERDIIDAALSARREIA
jgi:hypothetical protein